MLQKSIFMPLEVTHYEIILVNHTTNKKKE